MSVQTAGLVRMGYDGMLKEERIEVALAACQICQDFERYGNIKDPCNSYGGGQAGKKC